MLSIVDVPGHEAFIKIKLDGIGGIDAAILVIAATRRHAQTREHLAILDLLQVKGALVALTKSDLVPYAEWLEMVKADIRKNWNPRLSPSRRSSPFPVAPVKALRSSSENSIAPIRRYRTP